jgi:hypothetical protein
MDVTAAPKLVARELYRTWGNKPRIMRHYDEDESHSISVAQCENSPFDGITAVGTVGLCDHDLGMGPVRVELIGAFPTSFEYAPNVAATCAFNAFKDGAPTRPDSVHANVLALYGAGSDLPHILMADPYLWADGPNTLAYDDFRIAWLMMIPISEAERVFADTRGADILTTVFEKQQIDIFDLSRASVV